MRTVQVRACLVAALWVAGILPLLAFMGAAAPALAAPGTSVVDDVLVSNDGVHFASSLPAGLFESSGVLIPGGETRSTLWIQNPSDVPANVRVSLREPSGASADLTHYLTLVVEDDAAQTMMSVPLPAAAGCAVHAPAQSLAAGATLRVVLSVKMMDVSGLTAQNARARVGVLVALRDAAAGPFAPSACDDDGVVISAMAEPSVPQRPDALSRTGVDLPIPALIGGGLLLGAGALLITRRRRDRCEP